MYSVIINKTNGNSQTRGHQFEFHSMQTIDTKAKEHSNMRAHSFCIDCDVETSGCGGICWLTLNNNIYVVDQQLSTQNL